MIPGAFGSVSSPLNERGQERRARPLVVGCSAETGSDAGKVFLRASSSASSRRLRLSLSPSSRISVSLTALMKTFADMTQISVHANGISFASSGCVQRTRGDTSIGSFSPTGEGWKLMRRQRRRTLHYSAAVLHRLLHLLEGAHLDLAHAFARHTELGRQILERDRVVGKSPRLEDAPLALVEHRKRFTERLLAVLGFLVLDEPRLLIGDFVDEPVLPFAGIAVVADRGVERHVAAEAAIHV